MEGGYGYQHSNTRTSKEIQMIGIAKVCSGIKAICEYVLDHGRGYEVDRNLICGVSHQEISEEFLILQAQNSRAKNKTITVVISPFAEDGRNLSDLGFKEIAKKFLVGLGVDVEKSQHICFAHTDKDHKHLHIILNRVKLDGTMIDDRFIKLRGMLIAHEIALEKGFRSARSVMLETLETQPSMLYGDWRTKKEILFHCRAITEKGVNSLADFATEMSKRGVPIELVTNRNNELQGYRVLHTKTGSSYKASELNREMLLPSLFSKGAVPDPKQKLTRRLQRSFSSYLGGQLLKGLKKLERQTENEREHDR